MDNNPKEHLHECIRIFEEQRKLCLDLMEAVKRNNSRIRKLSLILQKIALDYPDIVEKYS